MDNTTYVQFMKDRWIENAKIIVKMRMGIIPTCDYSEGIAVGLMMAYEMTLSTVYKDKIGYVLQEMKELVASTVKISVEEVERLL